MGYEIPREIYRTMLSLAPEYQLHIAAREYEVIVVDNGSAPELQIGDVNSRARVIRLEDASPSPAAAVNRGLAEAHGDVIALMIDGARLVTPGLLHFGRHAVYLHERTVAATLGWYLGFDYQRSAAQAGYDKGAEDSLMGTIGWPTDGYRLFEIATMDDSSVDGWLPPISESGCLFLRRETWKSLGGADEAFVSPGGGLVNLDIFSRALALDGSELVVLLGEGTFHQLHGGVSTAIPPEDFSQQRDRWAAEYEAIRGTPYERPMPENAVTLVGTLPVAVHGRLARALIKPSLGRPTPLGEHFDPALWTARPPTRCADPRLAELIDLAHRELAADRPTGAAAIARLVRERAPDEPEPLRLLALLAPWVPFGEPASANRAEYHLALGSAYRMLGEREAAISHLRAALTAEPDLSRAHVELSLATLPGEPYRSWLERIYNYLRPDSVLEIGVDEGASLAKVPAPALAIGVDPAPRVTVPMSTQTRLFPETSDAFFEAGRLDDILAGQPLGIAFIDGLHLFEQALRDFVNVERHCGPRSAVLIHDTLPLDEPTQSRARDTGFHTGDVWKLVPCLAHYRTQLDVFTIATPWTGLTVITGFAEGDSGLAECYDEAVERFIETPYQSLEQARDSTLKVVANDWNAIQPRLEPLKPPGAAGSPSGSASS